MCASTVPTTSILMQSKSNRFPNGLGNDSGELGHNIMDHHFQIGADASYDGFEVVGTVEAHMKIIFDLNS